MDHIRTWERDGFRLELYDTHLTDSNGKSQLGYDFYCENILIFEGTDYFPSPLHAIDSDQAVAGLLGFLSLRPGDTDADYFDNYSDLQMEFVEQRAEELSFYAYDLAPEDAT